MFGAEIRKAGTPIPVQQTVVKRNEDAMEAGMLRAKNKSGIHAAAVIDLGAAEGTWTIKAEKVWPSADYILFEPLEERQKDLKVLAQRNPKIKPIFAAAGNKTGTVKFLVSDDLDGSGIYDAEKDGGNREVSLTTIDAEVKRLGVTGPFVIKFDTHGFEVPILEGAAETLKNTNLVIMECYGFRIAENCLLFPEMCAYMEKLGFRLADIINVVRRPGDELFWQCDAFFMPSANASFSKTSYA
ncbi:N/A [soil metagenome]